MTTISFKPWVGHNYAAMNRFNARVLILGESHHGARDSMHEHVTAEVVHEFAKLRRHPYFTTLAKFLLGAGREAWLSDEERSGVWDDVAFYNFVQQTVGDFRDSRPTHLMWQEAVNPLCEVLDQLKPQLLVVVGRELAHHLPNLPDALEVCRVRHPASGFCYSRWNPMFADSLAHVSSIRRLLMG